MAKGFNPFFLGADEHRTHQKRRTISDGTSHEILKNYYNAKELEALFSPLVSDFTIHTARFYWWLTYKVK